MPQEVGIESNLDKNLSHGSESPIRAITKAMIVGVFVLNFVKVLSHLSEQVVGNVKVPPT